MFGPIQYLWNRIRPLENDVVFDFDSAPRREPPISWNAKEPASIDHDPTRFWHRRDSKLHSSRNRFAVPRRICAALVFFPDPHPWEIGPIPDVAESQVRCR